MSLFVLYASRVVVGVYAYIIFCSQDPMSVAGTILIAANAALLLAALLLYNTKNAIDELFQIIAHGICVISTAIAAPNIIYALLIQSIGMFSDVQRAAHYLMLIQPKKA